jgi:8-oxo-dGTP pyrophosphatase MutT (NUDIX family)
MIFPGRVVAKKWYWARGLGFRRLSNQRRNALVNLWQKEWFGNTDPIVQNELLSLPESFDSFIKDLSERPVNVGRRRLIRLDRIAAGNFSIIPIFEVETTLGDGRKLKHTYEFHSWGQGGGAGCKGLVLLRGLTGDITHVVSLRLSRFATAADELESIGGFIEEGEDFNTAFIREVEEELGVSLGQFEYELVDLGELAPDSGLTATCAAVRALLVTATPGEFLGKRSDNPDVLEGEGTVLVFPVNQWGKMALKSRDGYLLSTLVRLLATGLLKPQIGLEKLVA